MKKNRFIVLEKLITILLLGVIVAGCKTTNYGVEITNVPRTNIRAVYIRNAGTTDWGYNVASILTNINRTRYSQTVDIRVVDNNGVVYSTYNVPFDDAAFSYTGDTKSLNIIGQLGLIVALAGTIWFIYKLPVGNFL